MAMESTNTKIKTKHQLQEEIDALKTQLDEVNKDEQIRFEAESQNKHIKFYLDEGVDRFAGFVILEKYNKKEISIHEDILVDVLTSIYMKNLELMGK